MVRQTIISLIWLALAFGGCGATSSEETTPDRHPDGTGAEIENDDVEDVESTDPDTTEEVIESSTPLP